MDTLYSAWCWAKQDVMNDFGIESDMTGTVATVLSLAFLIGLPLYLFVSRKRIKADILKGYRGE